MNEILKVTENLILMSNGSVTQLIISSKENYLIKLSSAGLESFYVAFHFFGSMCSRIRFWPTPTLCFLSMLAGRSNNKEMAATAAS